MKLYGSLQNRMMEAAKQPEPAIGMGATITAYTDRYACTIINIAPKMIVVQDDTETRTDSNGMSEMQEYTYERNPKGSLYTYRQDRNGRWREATYNTHTKRWVFVDGGRGLLIGDRRHYRDFSF